MEQELSTMTDLLRLGEFQQSKTLGYISRYEQFTTKRMYKFSYLDTYV